MQAWRFWTFQCLRFTDHPIGIIDGVIKPQPILRWAGGKRQLLEVLLAVRPLRFDLRKNNYFEPFLGGGALFFSLASQLSNLEVDSLEENGRSFFLSDTNNELINFYKVVRDQPKLLIKNATLLARSKAEKDFYEVRESSPQSQVGRAAKLLYLNRLCFNGLYRVNSKGGFNVPYGRLKNPTICNEELILVCSAWLKNAEIFTEHFSAATNRAKSGDLVYFDPPYLPLSKTASFSSYAKEEFNEDSHRELAAIIHGLTEKGVNVILSNSDTPLSREIFRNLNLYSVSASRSISASSKSRGRVQELIGTNYPASDMRESSRLTKFKIR